jgi:hypothetical protein
MGVVDGYEKPTREVHIANATGAEKIAEIQTRLVLARVGDAGLDDPAPQLERDLAAAKTEADESATVFVFKALSGREMEALKLAHPSTDPALNFDTITFPPALLTVSCIQAGDQDGLSSAEATELWDTYSDGDCQELYAAAWGVSTTAHLRPLSVTDTGNPDQNSAPNLTTALLEELHTASS